MAAQNGKDLLIKLDLTGTGNFETIAGLRATRLSFNAESVDVTTLESSGGWRELLGGAGVKSAAVSGSGVFKDAATDERARQIVQVRARARTPVRERIFPATANRGLDPGQKRAQLLVRRQLVHPVLADHLTLRLRAGAGEK